MILIAVIVVTSVVVIVARRYRPYGSRLRAGFHAEFLARPGGYPGLSQHYNFEFRPEPKQMDPSVIYKAVSDGSIDVTDGFATDGRIPAYDLVVLEDDKGCFPPQQAAPIVRSETLRKHPEIGEILNKLEGQITDETMQNLNCKVEEKGYTAAGLAREFLLSKGLIRPDARSGDGSAGSIAVGSRQSTEQEILGQIMATLIECNSDIKVVRKLNFGDAVTCFKALEDSVLDLYAEYTGIGLMDILKQEIILDLDRSYEMVRQVFESEHGLIWLKPFGFNNTYALIMRRDQSERLGIRTISDLAKYVRWQREGVPLLSGQF